MYLVAKRGITEMGCASIHIVVVPWGASLLSVFVQSLTKPENVFLSYQHNVAVLFAILFLFCFLRSHSLLLISLSVENCFSPFHLLQGPTPSKYLHQKLCCSGNVAFVDKYIYIYIYTRTFYILRREQWAAVGRWVFLSSVFLFLLCLSAAAAYST